MSDTVKIERPMCCRRHEDLGGRIKHDSLGNTIKVRTRVHDAQDYFAQTSPYLSMNPETGSPL